MRHLQLAKLASAQPHPFLVGNRTVLLGPLTRRDYRRFQCLCEDQGLIVLTPSVHEPTAIAVVTAAAQRFDPTLTCEELEPWLSHNPQMLRQMVATAVSGNPTAARPLEVLLEELYRPPRPLIPAFGLLDTLASWWCAAIVQMEQLADLFQQQRRESLHAIQHAILSRHKASETQGSTATLPPFTQEFSFAWPLLPGDLNVVAPEPYRLHVGERKFLVQQMNHRDWLRLEELCAQEAIPAASVEELIALLTVMLQRSDASVRFEEVLDWFPVDHHDRSGQYATLAALVAIGVSGRPDLHPEKPHGEQSLHRLAEYRNAHGPIYALLRGIYHVSPEEYQAMTPHHTLLLLGRIPYVIGPPWNPNFGRLDELTGSAARAPAQNESPTLPEPSSQDGTEKITPAA